DHLVMALRWHGIQFVRWNIDTYPLNSRFAVTGSGIGVLEVGGGLLPLERFRTAWFRRYPSAGPSLHTDGRGPAGYIADESRRALDGLFAIMDWRWVNHPESIYRATPKLRQLVRARGHGLEVPETVVGNIALTAGPIESKVEVVLKSVEGGIYRNE